jgi:polysaccharide biosynthesis transport protein
MKPEKRSRLRATTSNPPESDHIDRGQGPALFAIRPFGQQGGAAPDSTRAYIRSVSKRKLLVIGCALVGAAIATVISIVAIVPCRATVTVLFATKSHRQEMSARNRLWSIGPNGEEGTPTELFRGIIRAAPLERAILARMQAALSGASLSRQHQGGESLSGALAADLRRYPIEIKALDGGALAQIHTRSTEPEVAAAKLASCLEAYATYYTERQLGNARKAARWLKDELSRAEAAAKQAEATLEEFSRRNAIPASEAETQFKRTETRALKNEHEQVQGRLAGWEEHKKSLLLHTWGDPSGDEDVSIVVPLKAKLERLQAEYNTLLETYDPSYYRAAALRVRIQVLKKKLAEAEDEAAVSSLAYLRKEEGVLRDALAGANAEAARVVALGPQYRQLELEVETSQRLRELIRREYGEAEKLAEIRPKAFSIIQSPAVERIYRKSSMWGLVGGLLGLAGGALLAVLIDSVAARVQHPDDIRHGLGFPILGALPKLPGRGASFRGAKSAVPDEFLVYDDPGCPMANAVRSVQATVFLSALGRNLKTIAVSSAIPGEGKTYTAISLAVSLAAEGRTKVLVIDADLRRPRVHGVFGRRHPGEGLSTLITRKRVDWTKLVRLHRIRGLYYVSSGPIPDDPVAILNSPRLRESLRRMRGYFDYIVLDAPPVLGFPDALLLSGVADATLLVAEERRVAREDLREAVRSVCSVSSALFLGVIINKARS